MTHVFHSQWPVIITCGSCGSSTRINLRLLSLTSEIRQLQLWFRKKEAGRPSAWSQPKRPRISYCHLLRQKDEMAFSHDTFWNFSEFPSIQPWIKMIVNRNQDNDKNINSNTWQIVVNRLLVLVTVCLSLRHTHIIIITLHNIRRSRRAADGAVTAL